MVRIGKKVASLVMVLLLGLTAACAPAVTGEEEELTPTEEEKEEITSTEEEVASTPTGEWGTVEIRVTDPPPPGVRPGQRPPRLVPQSEVDQHEPGDSDQRRGRGLHHGQVRRPGQQGREEHRVYVSSHRRGAGREGVRPGPGAQRRLGDGRHLVRLGELRRGEARHPERRRGQRRGRPSFRGAFRIVGYPIRQIALGQTSVLDHVPGHFRSRPPAKAIEPGPAIFSPVSYGPINPTRIIGSG